ncbi:dynamin family protein [Peptoanaerobacter stomatis]|uniref:dynamin family protein n=1 Tax=Peptoanaerobacter stomatis TaxID=796937 RepID=UPI003FA15F33
MREISIKYNPYRLETEVLIDGSNPKQNSRLNVEDRRLQEWIEDLPEILFEECSDRNFKVIFYGTQLDYEDVATVSQEAKNNEINIQTEHIQAKEVSDKEALISEIFEEIQSGPFEELKKPDIVRAFEMAKSSDFEVNVVATMSAGKSTLINALLQRKLMPSKQEACTATITEIKDNDSDYFNAKVYDSANNLIQSYDNLSLNIMNSLNSNPDVSKIKIEGDIPFVTADDVSLVIVDTPGPNNSRDQNHKEATYRMLSESSKMLVLYILNATQLAVNDDYNLLSHVAESMKVGGKQSRDRFIFVVNKLDDFRKGEDSVESAITKVREYLKDNGIENPNIYPASALTALNIRTILAESDDDDDDEVYEAKGKVRKFNKNTEMYFETFAPLTPSVRGQIETMLVNARENNDIKEEALIHCGIIPIELAIKTYVQKYAKTAKIKNIVDTFSKNLESAKSFEETKKEISQNQDKQREILANIDSIKRKLASGEETKGFRERINNINYKSVIKSQADKVIAKFQKKITEQYEHSQNMNKKEAEYLCNQFSRFVDSLQAEVKVKLEEVIQNNVFKTAEDLLEEYKNKLSELAQDIEIGGISIDPFQLMQGDISVNASSLINSSTTTERVKVDEVWIENTDKKWYKPWTWFQESGHYKSIYEDREYVDAEKLSQAFFAPVQEQLYINGNDAVEYANRQSDKIKQDFSEKFSELDEVLKNKLQELENCANDNKAVEQRIRESEDKLRWLENIQAKTKSILDI